MPGHHELWRLNAPYQFLSANSREGEGDTAGRADVSFPSAPRQAREAQAFPPVPSGGSLICQLLTLAAVTRVCPQAPAVGNRT